MENIIETGCIYDRIFFAYGLLLISSFSPLKFGKVVSSEKAFAYWESKMCTNYTSTVIFVFRNMALSEGQQKTFDDQRIGDTHWAIKMKHREVERKNRNEMSVRRSDEGERRSPWKVIWNRVLHVSTLFS